MKFLILLSNIGISSMLLMSCTRPCVYNETPLDELLPDSSEMVVVNLPKPSVPPKFKTLKYSELFSEVEYIPLESTETSTIGSIDKLEFVDDGFVTFDMRNYNIVRFDTKGKYMNNIGLRGNGPGEYILPIDVVYDRYDKQVIVFDNAGCLLFYALDGTFSNKVDIPWYVGSVCVLDEERLAINTFSTDSYGNKSGRFYNYYTIKKDGTVLSHYDPYDNNSYNKQTRDVHFGYYNENVFVNSQNSYSVFSFYEDKMLPTHKVIMEGIKTFDESTPLLKRPLLHSFYETDDYYVGKLVGAVWYCFVFDKHKRTGKIYNRAKNDLIGPSSVYMCNVKDNKFYYCCDPSEFSSFCSDEDDELEEEMLSMFSKLSSNKNPILQICTLKK